MHDSHGPSLHQAGVAAVRPIVVIAAILAAMRLLNGRSERIGSTREQGGLDTPSPLALAALVLTAPGWVRVGIAAPNERTREAAALELGVIIAERIERPVEVALEGQMSLPL